MEKRKAISTIMDDDLFLERLESFLERNLMDINAFAQREARSAEEIRQRVAEWHCKFLFESINTQGQSFPSTDCRSTGDRAREILEVTSRGLETLHTISGRHSMLLVVDPANDSDEGFLGGTIAGREFWRGLRSGGVSGAKAFKDRCKKAAAISNDPPAPEKLDSTTQSGSRTTPSMSAKNDLYVKMRVALRAACGIRDAEMKWSKPDKLKVYGVRIVGWPDDIEAKNPSQMTIMETTTIIELLESRQLRFEAINGPTVSLLVPGPPGHVNSTPIADDGSELNWACNDYISGADSQTTDSQSPHERKPTPQPQTALAHTAVPSLRHLALPVPVPLVSSSRRGPASPVASGPRSLFTPGPVFSSYHDAAADSLPASALDPHRRKRSRTDMEG